MRLRFEPAIVMRFTSTHSLLSLQLCVQNAMIAVVLATELPEIIASPANQH